MSPAQMPLPRPAQTFVFLLASPIKKGSTFSQESCSWSILESFLTLLSLDPRCPFFFPSFPHPSRLTSWEKETDGFFQKSHHVPSPPPFSPTPLAFRSLSTAVAMVTVQGRLDLLLPAGHRYSTRAMNARVVGLPLAPVLWMPMGHSWHMLHGP